MRYLLIAVLMIIINEAISQKNWTAPDNPVELGQVHWLRNYDDAIKQSITSGLPILILFQEVPGCSNCTTYGNHVLSHPFMVEMITTHFVPLAIFNNKGGADKKILARFKEPAWNNPVVRIVNSKGHDLLPRLSGDFSQKGLSLKIKAALGLSGQVEPAYFSIWREELNGQANESEAYLSMYCFWTGEKEIAKIPGVLSTEAGFMHGKEVVKVTYNNEATHLKKIVSKAKKKNCADQVYTDDNLSEIADKGLGKYRPDKEIKYYLHKNSLKVVPMTPLQAARVNSALGEGKDPKHLLSPRQLTLSKKTALRRSCINQDFAATWYKVIGAL